jgi:hypothetical protein
VRDRDLEKQLEEERKSRTFERDGEQVIDLRAKGERRKREDRRDGSQRRSGDDRRDQA